MGRLKNGTICSKHEDIKTLADRILDLVDKCLEDGQNMESGLDEKKKRIEELEEENEDFKKDIAKYEQDTDELKAYIKELEAHQKEQG